jgi:hypothetical protein
MTTLPESDWKVLRALHPVTVERYCAQVLDECASVLRDDQHSAHERYLRLFRLIEDRDDHIADAFNDLRRSTAVQRLAAMINLSLVNDDELARFTAATRESATALAEIFAPPKKRPRDDREQRRNGGV